MAARALDMLFASALGATLLVAGNTMPPSVLADRSVPDTLALPMATTTQQSLNWAGYIAERSSVGADFTAISGTWRVPSVSDGDLAADATWVGIGGLTDRNLIQAGTQAIVDPGQGVEYQAWVEELPGDSEQVPLPVHPGDSVTVTLAEVSAGQWRVTITNNTSGQQYTNVRAYDSSHESAEWIEEMPSANVFIPLDNFDLLHVTNAWATAGGRTLTPAAASARPVTMVNLVGDALALPTVLSTRGNEFGVRRSSAPALSAQHWHGATTIEL